MSFSAIYHIMDFAGLLEAAAVLLWVLLFCPSPLELASRPIRTERGERDTCTCTQQNNELEHTCTVRHSQCHLPIAHQCSTGYMVLHLENACRMVHETCVHEALIVRIIGLSKLICSLGRYIKCHQLGAFVYVACQVRHRTKC